MTFELVFVFALLGLTITLFILDRIRMDIVAMMVVVALAVSGVLSPAESVSGFGQSVVIMIGALFVIGEGLLKTGVAAAIGRWLLRVGGHSEVRLLLLLLPVVALLSAFMSSTGAVAIFIPVVMSMCRRANLSPGRMMMPLAFASLMGGTLTLIGTPPNVVVSAALESSGQEAFGFFDFAAIGLPLLIVGSLYLVFVARHLLPVGTKEAEAKSLLDFARRYGVERNLQLLEVPMTSGIIGKTVTEIGLRAHYETTLFAIKPAESFVVSLLPVISTTKILGGDKLMVYGEIEDVQRLCIDKGLLMHGFPKSEMQGMHQEFGYADVVLNPNSSLVGKTIREGQFRHRFSLSVIGVRRNQQSIVTSFNNQKLYEGDTLLLVGGWRYLQELESERDLIVIDSPAEMHDAPARSERGPVAIGIMLGMLGLMVSGVLPSLSAVLLAAFAMIATGCVRIGEAYKSLNAMSLVLIAGMLPLALAMKKTGGLDLIVDTLMDTLGDSGPLVLCGLLFVITAVLSQVISNTATTVLMAPIGLAAALGLGVSPEPVLMSIAMGASTAFMTPIASPVNSLVLGPGNYRFKDFVRVGSPLMLISFVLSMVLIPIFFPF